MSFSQTDIANMALARIGCDRINDFDTSANVQAIYCRLFYVQDRDFLLRSHWWRFAAARATLAANVTAPDFEWDYAYDLPADFLALRSIYVDNSTVDDCSVASHALEGLQLLSNDSPMEIRYTKQVTDPAQFDPLFVEVLRTKMALDMLYPVCKVSAVGAADRLQNELDKLMQRVFAMDRQEQNLVGRENRMTWLWSRRVAVSNGPVA